MARHPSDGSENDKPGIGRVRREEFTIIPLQKMPGLNTSHLGALLGFFRQAVPPIPGWRR